AALALVALELFECADDRSGDLILAEESERVLEQPERLAGERSITHRPSLELGRPIEQRSTPESDVLIEVEEGDLSLLNELAHKVRRHRKELGDFVRCQYLFP